jgi:hypothetical protein
MQTLQQFCCLLYIWWSKFMFSYLCVSILISFRMHLLQARHFCPPHPHLLFQNVQGVLSACLDGSSTTFLARTYPWHTCQSNPYITQLLHDLCHSLLMKVCHLLTNHWLAYLRQSPILWDYIESTQHAPHLFPPTTHLSSVAQMHPHWKENGWQSHPTHMYLQDLLLLTWTQIIFSIHLPIWHVDWWWLSAIPEPTRSLMLKSTN